MTIFNSIGNLFKTGWNNGNLAKGIQALGMTAFGVGATGAMIHSMNNNSCNGSIFGNSGCCGGGYGYYGGPSFVPPELMANPMGILNHPVRGQIEAYNGYSMGGSFYGGNMFGSANMFGNMFGGNYLSNFSMLNALQQTQQNVVTTDNNNNTKAKFAAHDENQSTEQGQKIVEDMSKMAKDNSGSVKLFDKPENFTKYKEQVSEAGKSLAAYLDKEGTKDGKVTKEEFVAKYYGGAETTEEKALAEAAFKKVDINGDGKADWKELSAMLMALESNKKDGDSKFKVDGTITSAESAKNIKSMVNEGSTEFDNNIKGFYKQLFGE